MWKCCVAGQEKVSGLRQEAWERRKRCSNITETFRWNSAGSQSRLAELAGSQKRVLHRVGRPTG